MPAGDEAARVEEQEQLPSETVMGNYVQEKCEAGLLFLMGESELPLFMQYKLVKDGYKSSTLFAALAKKEDDVRDIIHSDFDVEKNKAGRLICTQVVVIWKKCRTQSDVEDKLTAEARSLFLPRPLGGNEYDLMVEAYEKKWGEIPKAKKPTLGFVQYKLDELEQGRYKATPLFEVTAWYFEDSGPSREQEDASGVRRFG